MRLLTTALLLFACGDDAFVCPEGFEREANGCVVVETDADTGTPDGNVDTVLLKTLQFRNRRLQGILDGLLGRGCRNCS